MAMRSRSVPVFLSATFVLLLSIPAMAAQQEPGDPPITIGVDSKTSGKGSPAGGDACPTCLPDGTPTRVSGGQLFLAGARGQWTVAKDGTYTFRNGTRIAMVKGRIASQGKAATGPLKRSLKRPGTKVRTGDDDDINDLEIQR